MKRIIGILLVAALMFILIPKSNTTYEGDQLIFVYRANSGPTSLALDFIHKIVSPKTYSCNLCNVTYGNFSMKDRWREYIESIDIPVTFEYEDTIKNKSKIIKDSLKPCAYIKRDGQYVEILSSKEINDCKNLDQLILLLDSRLK